jgi:hypothetical protein
MRVLTSGSGFNGKPWISSVEISKYEIAGVMLESSTLMVLDRMVDTNPEVRACAYVATCRKHGVYVRSGRSTRFIRVVSRVGGTIDYYQECRFSTGHSYE